MIHFQMATTAICLIVGCCGYLTFQTVHSYAPFVSINDRCVFHRGGSTTAVTGSRSNVSLRRMMMSGTSNNNNNDDGRDDDPTKVWYAGIANGIQNLLTNTPLKEGKKALVKTLAGDYDRVAVRAKLEHLIDSSPVLMLSFTKCPFCIKAKAILDKKNAAYEVVELDTAQDGKALRAEMADIVDRTSVPALWISGMFVGGCNDGPTGGIVRLDETGDLDSMLRAAGSI